MCLTNRNIGRECALNLWKSHVISMSEEAAVTCWSRRPTTHHSYCTSLTGEQVLIALLFYYIRCFEAGQRRLHSAPCSSAIMKAVSENWMLHEAWAKQRRHLRSKCNAFRRELHSFAQGPNFVLVGEREGVCSSSRSWPATAVRRA